MDAAVLVYHYHYFDPRKPGWTLSTQRATMEAITRHGWRVVPGSGRPVFRHTLAYEGLARGAQQQG